MGLIAGQITHLGCLFGRYSVRQHAVTVTTLNVKTPHVVKRYEGFFLKIVPLIIKVYNFDEEFNKYIHQVYTAYISINTNNNRLIVYYYSN